MYFLLPFINYGINSLNKYFHKNIVIFFIFFYSIYNVIAKFLCLNSNFNFLNDGYSSMWLIILYIIGAYFGKYIILNENKSSIIHFTLYLLIFFFSTLFNSEFYFILIRSKSKIQKNIFISYLSPTIVIQAIALVMFFMKLKIKNIYLIKIISFLTPLNFSAQLIHARLFQTKLRIIIYLFKWILMFKTKILFCKIYGVGIMIYIFCILIDYIRFLAF